MKGTFHIDDLTEEAQQKAYEEWLNSPYHEYNWDSESLDTIRDGLRALGASLDNYSIDWGNANGSNVSFSCECPVEDNPVRLRTWVLNNHYDVLFKPKKFGKRTSKILYTTTDCPLTGMCFDEDFLDPLRAFIKRPTNLTWKELLEDCARGVLKAAEADYNHQMSFEGFLDTARANEFEYEEDGLTVEDYIEC